jgi:hypothetical protein
LRINREPRDRKREASHDLPVQRASKKMEMMTR